MAPRRSSGSSNPNYTRGHSINEGGRSSAFGVTETLRQGNPRAARETQERYRKARAARSNEAASQRRGPRPKGRAR